MSSQSQDWEDVETLNVDFDHTITQRSTDEYLPPSKQSVNPDMVERLLSAYYEGKTIIVWTARPWSDAAEVVSMLTLWGVPFHGVMMGKGGSDIYIDDKMMSPQQFIDLPARLEEEQSRLDEL